MHREFGVDLYLRMRIHFPCTISYLHTGGHLTACDAQVNYSNTYLVLLFRVQLQYIQLPVPQAPI
jgi:hypothetical protein